MQKIILVLFCGASLMLGCVHSDRQPAATDNLATVKVLSDADRKEYEKLLRDSLSFYNNQLRNDMSGQYYDAAYMRFTASKKIISSSVAATGMGLVALALSDLLKENLNARAQALQTLRSLTGQEVLFGKKFVSRRSKQGWYRHWFDAETGDDDMMSVADGFSTIDTAILVAGAQLAANYFSAVGKDTDGQLKVIADWMLTSVDWGSAVADLEKGHLYLNYDIKDSKPLGTTNVFNEYVLVACMGKVADQKAKRTTAISKFWDQHYSDPQNLPRNNYEGHMVLTDSSQHYLSSFTIQFGVYLCGNVSKSPVYLQDMASAQRADRKWFETKTNRRYMWGMGAGETRFFDSKEGRVQAYYHADSINNNPQLMVSPHIIAGFLPVYPDGIYDLLEMKRRGECVYGYGPKEILWRCSLLDLTLLAERLQAIDYSSMVLGLSAFHPQVGLGFFQKYAAGSQ